MIEDDNIPPTTAQAKDNSDCTKSQRSRDSSPELFQIRQQDSGDQDDTMGCQEYVPKLGAGVLMLKGMPLVIRM